MPRIDSNTINTITNIVKSPADAIAIVKGSNGEMTENKGQVITITFIGYSTIFSIYSIFSVIK